MLIARIITSCRYEISDGPDDFYIGPERHDIALEGVNCPTAEFIELFLQTKTGAYFCNFASSNMLSDIGGAALDLTEGSYLYVNFDEWLISRLGTWERSVKLEIERMCEEAIARL